MEEISRIQKGNRLRGDRRPGRDGPGSRFKDRDGDSQQDVPSDYRAEYEARILAQQERIQAELERLGQVRQPWQKHYRAPEEESDVEGEA